jgi:hypothetical protein
LLPNGDNRITDLLDGALQIAFCHSKMSKPATNFSLILHGNMAAVTLALAGKYIAHKLSYPGLKQQIRAVCESFARQRPIDFGVSPCARRQQLGIATYHARLVCPVDPGNIDIIAKPHHVLTDA